MFGGLNSNNPMPTWIGIIIAVCVGLALFFKAIKDAFDSAGAWLLLIPVILLLAAIFGFQMWSQTTKRSDNPWE